MPTAFFLYESCVQNPELAVKLLRGIHGASPRILAEDFCGSAALSRAWVRAIANSRAIAVDIDPAPLKHAKAEIAKARAPHRGKSRGKSLAQAAQAVRILRADVLTSAPLTKARADVLFVGNFSIGEIPDRATLVRYLARSRKRLLKGGVFVCDIYSGESAFRVGTTQREYILSDGTRVKYTWEQRTADPFTARVENALHFRVFKGSELVQDLRDAFVYHWRLWSIPELRDAMLEAGFDRVDVYAQLPDAEDSDGNVYASPVDDAGELGPSFIVCVAARNTPKAARRSGETQS
jgi:hypothetical protein